MIPKLKFLLIILPIFFQVTSCSKDKNDVIPDVYVDFYIDLNDPEFFELNSIGVADTVDRNTNNLGQKAAGYDDNGIIIYRAMPDQFYAYDRTCPHDFAVNNTSVKIKLEESYFAKCPVCGTVYDLFSGGVPYSGIGKYPLKNYRTAFSGQILHVWNY
jgi:nitrite reductase/ring-hydroxylating ferredoxin subunit